MEIFPLTRPGDTFSMTFWNHIIHAGNDEESGVLYEEGSDTMYRLQVLLAASHLACTTAPCNLQEMIRSKCKWALSLCGGLMQSQDPLASGCCTPTAAEHSQ